MKLSAHDDPSTFDGDLLVLCRYAEAGPSAAEQAIDEALGGALSAAAERMRFKGKPHSSVAVDTLGKLPASRVMLIGLGEADDLKPAGLRDCGALAVNAGLDGRYGRVGIALAEPSHTEQVALGGLLGIYRFDDFKADPEDGPRPRVDALTVIGGDAGAFGRADKIAAAVNTARTLTNEPPNVCTPERLAELAREIAEAPNMSLRVFEKAEIYEKKMGGIIGVSRGSVVEPRLIHLSYVPEGHDGSDAIAFVGKGITFDAGGLSIKPAKGMAEMYIDMAGAAAVISTMHAVAALQPDVPVHGIVGACENMLGADAYRPSDILTMYSGKTVEVLNTDAEGRLVLADALHYVTELEPAVRGVVDAATLTGSCMVALGSHYAGCFSDHEPLCAEVLAAAEAADEKMWRLPLDPKLAKTLESKRADIKNIGGPWGGAITAAQFLQNFKGEVPWVHLDIAGAVLADADDGHIRAGGTGYGVLTMLALVESGAKTAGA